MNMQNLFAQKTDFASQVKAAMERLQQESDKDPDTFKGNVARLEKEWGNRTDAVERSVVHALLGSCYKEMKWTDITDFDEETRAEYTKKCDEHFSHVLDDMEALAGAKATAYAMLLQRGKDSGLYGDDMLSVMVSFLDRNASMATHEEVEMYGRAKEVYRRRGNLNGYGMMALEWLEQKRCVERKYGWLNEAQYRDSLYQLLQEVKDVEIGADVALGYAAHISTEDDRILFLQGAVQQVADSRRKGDLKGMLAELTKPHVEALKNTDVLAGKPARMSLSFWNCDRATLTVRHYMGHKAGKNGQGELLLTGAVVEKREVRLPLDSLNANRKEKGLPVKGVAETTLTLPAGRYVMVAEAMGNRSVAECRITSLRVLVSDKDKEHFNVYVLDNETGRPVPDVKVQLREQLPSQANRTAGWEDRDIAAELLTDAGGVVEVKKNLWLRAVKDERDCTSWTRHYGTWNTYRASGEVLTLSLLTDRSLYRPGQEVQGTVLAYVQQGDETRVKAGEALTLTVQDSQGNEVSRQELQTGGMGTAAFAFTLPGDCAVGTLWLSVDNHNGAAQWHSVRVEEYKRPTFEVTMDGKKTGKFGQTSDVEGVAMMFAGVPVQGAMVRYTVECAPSFFRRWWWPGLSWKSLDEGELTTDDEGRFRVPVTLTDEYLTDDFELMRFRVKATVTDLSGESHEGEWAFNVSNKDGVVDVVVDGAVDLAKDAAFKVKAYDVNHEDVTLTGTYQVLCGEKVMAEGLFTSGEATPLPKTLPLGACCELVAFVQGAQGPAQKESAHFVAYSSALPVTSWSQMNLKEKRRADGDVQESDFLHAESDTFAEGGTVDFYLATQETDAYIIYNVYNVDGLLESHVAVTDGTMKRIRLQHRKEWGEGIMVSIAYVRNGHYAWLSHRFSLAKPEKELKLEWATFRDKLQPGQQEQWTLTVADKDGRRVSGAEMAAVLYDASLDRLCPHQWDFDLNFSRRLPNSRYMEGGASWMPAFMLYGTTPRYGSYIRTFDQLNGFVHDRYRRNRGRLLYSKAALSDVAVASQAAMAGPVMGGPAMMDAETAEEGAMEMDAPENEQKRIGDDAQVAIRENFAETAFFLPQLVSDLQGNVNIQFTLPESLTEWKFMGFVHTKDVDYGTIKATAVARKAFMLRPNMPRFVRWGDRAVIASSVVNQSEGDLQGAARLRLLDAETGEVVLAEEKPFAVEAGKTVAVDFAFEVSADWKALDCELVAVSGGMSDGEKNLLPVLSSKKDVVETVPFYIVGNADGTDAEKSVDLTPLFNRNSASATSRELKVEYTDNPAWMCIEALRSVKNPETNDAISFAASLYANTRLVELMQTFPLLEKNESGEELQQRAEQAKVKLQGLQKADGGWSWFEGMESSYYVTLAVCERLVQMPLPTQEVKEMLHRGMAFLDKHELDAYNERLKHTKKVWASESELRYLYLSAMVPERSVSREVQAMREKYLSLVEKQPRDLTIYGVANAAYALRSFGHVKAADKFVDFLKDYMVEKPGLGRFYATDAAYYSWMDYRIPTQVAAMKAIRQKNKADACLNDMQLWLIAQKQVQKWDNPMNTIDVVDLLLKVSPTTTFHVSQQPVLEVDGVQLADLAYGTVNTERDALEGRESLLTLQGNVLANVPDEVIADGVQQLDVKKRTQGISWGAAYAVFLEDVEHLDSYATDELKIQRKLYVQAGGSDQWTEWKKGQSVSVGDKLRIRHIVTADRDMDFVRVTAQHPACLEPVRHLSGYQWMGGRSGYLSIHDAGFDVFFDWFTRGTAIVDMDYYVAREGVYETGISTVECAYAKQFGGHTDGVKVSVKAGK